MSRIGIRMLIGTPPSPPLILSLTYIEIKGQHITLCRGVSTPDYVGIICLKTKIQEIAQEAIENARYICQDYYGLFRAPEVHLHCPDNLEFQYVPSHLHHMLFELLKNSLRAIVESYGPDEEDRFPPIKIAVAEGREDITIKVSDEGGGIPRSGMRLIWTYMYSTAATPELEPDYSRSDFKAPMAGLGYGLPLSRLVLLPLLTDY